MKRKQRNLYDTHMLDQNEIFKNGVADAAKFQKTQQKLQGNR